MRFLLHGNAPTVLTGYGVQLAQLGERLQKAGHDVAYSATYGIAGHVPTWKGMRIYPCGYEINSNDLIHAHAAHWFGEDPHVKDSDCWIITCIDVWAMTTPRLADFNVAAWVPIDHFPVPPAVLDFFSRTQAVPVAMSKFGERLLFDAGLDPVYIPLAVDTDAFRPTPTLDHDGQQVSGRSLMGVPEDAFVIGMVGMNKGWARDRKGFNEAFRAVGHFMQAHDDAVLYVHAEKWGGAEGQNLVELAIHAGIPDHRLVWAGGEGQYGYRIGFTPDMMAAQYTAMDVLLAPSHGEGFCVPVVEAQACGTPVIVTDFSAQPELVGAGWKVFGQPEWNPAMHASYVVPFIASIVDRLEEAYAADREALAGPARDFAVAYDVDRVFVEFWEPLLVQLADPGVQLDTEREPMPEKDAVAVLVPVKGRPENVAPLVDSFFTNTPLGEATLYFVYDPDDKLEVEELSRTVGAGIDWRPNTPAVCLLPSDRGESYAHKLNVGYQHTTQPWVLCVGDDVRFHKGWLDAARSLSDRFDVIGTNDSPDGQPRNPKVASGAHADHFFVRRAYVEEHGGCLDGPGILAPECYRHWFTDVEIVKLAKARGVFTPCLDSIVEHLHPGYDWQTDRVDEYVAQLDPIYRIGVDHGEADKQRWKSRQPLVEMQRTSRGRAA